MAIRFPECDTRRYSRFVETGSRLFDNMSMLTVAELAAAPDLGLELVAGHGGADREIEAAAVSELADPGPWPRGRRAAPDHRAAAARHGRRLPVVPGRGSTPPVCRRSRWDWRCIAASMRAAAAITVADELGMPLRTVPDPVPFIAVTKAVFDRARTERQELEWALQTQRALTVAAVTPGGLLGILAAHREATGRNGVVATCSAGCSRSRMRAVSSSSLRCRGCSPPCAIRASTRLPPISATGDAVSYTRWRAPAAGLAVGRRPR